MGKTSNFNLNKPEPADLVRVADFNANSDIIDAALNTLNTAVAACAKIATGSNVGDGKYGSANPTTLTFDFAPKMVVIWIGNYTVTSTGSTSTRVGYWGPTFAVLLPNVSRLYYSTGRNDATATVLSFSGNSVQSYNDTSYINCQWNASGTTYYYFAIGV